MSFIPLPIRNIRRVLLTFELKLIFPLICSFFLTLTKPLHSVRVHFPMYGSENNREDSERTAFRRTEKKYKLYYDNNASSKNKKYLISSKCR